MKIFARHSLVDRRDRSSDDELLLEGGWQMGRLAAQWSLDEAIDTRFAQLDRLAMDLADRASQDCQRTSPAVNFAYVNALALRYYLVKLLRPIAFFQHVRPLRKGEMIDLHLGVGDEDYAHVLRQVARLRQANVTLHWHRLPTVRATEPRMKINWRPWAGRLRRWRPSEAALPGNCDVTRVVLCGNPRVLNPICAELVDRGARVYWLYETFAVRCWWRWRAAGVEQLVCAAGRRAAVSFGDVSVDSDLVSDGIDLAPLVERWLSQRADEVGHRQSLLVERVAEHFRRVRPTALVLDEDATPLKRIAVALARPQGAKSTVVQHGAPCGPFGFLPLAADEIAVWGESSRRQLQTWGLSDDRIRVAGWPSFKPQTIAAKRVTGTPKNKRFLLLATRRPRDERPDNLEFHLTSENYAAMLDMVVSVLSQIEGASLTIKLHPRDSRKARSWSRRRTGRWERHGDTETRGQGEQELSVSPCLLASRCDSRKPANHKVRVVHSHDLPSLIAASDCVLSCASTAGIEAALAGAPVIQLLPRGSGNVLAANEWGLVGSARSADDLAPLIEQALSRGWHKDPYKVEHVLATYGRTAAARVVDGVMSPAQSTRHFSQAA